MQEKTGFRPFIPADKIMAELTPFSIVMGILLAVVFGAANAYLGLRVGMTISASIPAAVISMGIMRGIMRRDSILENNMVQTICSAGEATAGGAIFTLPAFFLWFTQWGQGAPSYLLITIIALAGGVLGVMFMIPLRRALIVNEHETLPYPEGTACAEVLLAGEAGGGKAKTTFLGALAGFGYKFLADGLRLFPSSVEWTLPRFKGTALGVDTLPALLGVGYIIGPKTSAYVFAGGCAGWFCIMPLIYYFGSFATEVIAPGTVLISAMNHNALWSSYLRYIGTGAVAFGGLYSLIRTLPSIAKTFRASMRGLFGSGAKAQGSIRTDTDISFRIAIITVILVIAALIILPASPISPVGGILILVLGFFFSAVSARTVGTVGSSNSPVSGMTIAALLITALLYSVMGRRDNASMIAVMSVASVIAIIAAISGDTSQDLKTGYLLGATPKKQQAGELIGVAAAALAIGGILMLLNSAWGFGSTELPAVQASMMKLIVEGVMGGDLPWVLVLAGAGIALMLAVLRLPVLPICIGLYLPLSLQTAIMAGGLLRLVAEKGLSRKGLSGSAMQERLDGGTLYASGLIAGEGLMGILLALFAVLKFNLALPFSEALPGQLISVIAFALLGFSLLKSSLWRKEAR